MIATQMHSFYVTTTKKKVLFPLLQVFAASLFLAFCAQISIPLYFSPVPLSGQTLGVMLVGVTLGSRMGLLSVLAYLIEGSLGLPVFAGGHCGVMSLLGTNGGYFLGFAFQAYCVGLFTERQSPFSAAKMMIALLLSCVLQLTLGCVWLSFFVGLKAALFMGFYPFILGELLKVLALTSYLKSK